MKPMQKLGGRGACGAPAALGESRGEDEGWKDVWGQLGGTTLSVWDMQEIEEANKHGREVPPTYINITDAVSVKVPRMYRR